MPKRGMVYQRGNIWWIKFYRHGKPFFESSGSTKKMVANNLLERRLGEVSQGKAPGIHFDRVTYGDLETLLVNDYALSGQQRPRTAHLKNFFKYYAATEITTSKVKEYITSRQEQGASNATVNREISALHRMFTLGKQETPPKVHEVPYMPKLTEDNVKQGFFEDIAFEVFREALPDHLKGFATFGYLTGWRKEEAANLTWDRVDLEARIIRLNPGETKNKEGRNLYMENELLWILQDQDSKRINGCPYVFHRKGFKLNGIRFSWNRACRESKLGYGYRINDAYAAEWEEKGLSSGPTYHDFRRTAVRNMIRAGIPRRVAMMRSGHKTEAVFNRYDIVDNQDLKMAADKLDDSRKEKSQYGYRNGYNQASDLTPAIKLLLFNYLILNGSLDKNRTATMLRT